MEHEGPVQRPDPVAATASRRAPVSARRATVQRSLQVGRVDDPFEREADAVADRVVAELLRTSDVGIAPTVGAAGGRIQRRADVDDPAAGPLDGETHRRIQVHRGRGAPLDAESRARMEHAFDADFRAVRVHEGAEADDLNTRIQAKAFTIGNNIFFRDGLPETASRDGQRLLAHELTHTIQQQGRVRRSPVAVRGRVGGPVVQRDGETKKAYDALQPLVEKAKTLEAEALAGGVDAATLEEKVTAIGTVWTDANEHVRLANVAKSDSTAQNFKTGMNQRLAQIKAKWEKVNGKEAKANSAATSIARRLPEFRKEALKALTGARQRASNALTQLRTIGAPTTTLNVAATCAKDARTEHATLTTACREFELTSATTLQEASGWVEDSKGDNRKQEVAETASKQITACEQLTVAAIKLLRDDTDQVAKLAETMLTAWRAHSKATKAEKESKTAADERAAAAETARQLLEKAEADDRKAAEAVEETKRLLDEAIGKAKQAELAADVAKTSATSATRDAEAKANALPFLRKHLLARPSPDASAIVDKRRAEASDATTSAAALTETSKKKAHEAATLRADTKPPEEEHERARQRGTGAAEQKTAAGRAHESEKQRAEAATKEHTSAQADTATRLQEARDAKAALRGHITSVDQLAADIPDEDLRTRLRVSFGDAGLLALRAKGLRVDVLDTCEQPLVVAIATWGSDGAADVVLRLQTLAAGGPVPLAAFWKSADGTKLTGAKALQVLDCLGDDFGWWIEHGVSSSVALLALTWPPAQVGSLMRVARNDAVVGGLLLDSFVGLITRANLTSADAEKLLKASGVTRYYVTSYLLTGVESLLVTEHWSVDKVLELVTASDAGPKLYQADFEKFCGLVHDSALSDENSIKIMKAATCTAAYLVGKAFAVVRDAVLAGWSEANIKDMVDAAETKATFSKKQFKRFWALVHTNNFTAANAVKCLKSTGVASWDDLMTLVDHFVADNNTGNPGAVGGVAQAELDVDDPDDATQPVVRVVVTVERVGHFCSGHTYAHYQFTTANIRRGDGNQPSTMWPVGTTAANVAASATAAIGNDRVKHQAHVATAGLGTRGMFDQHDHATYTAGVEWKPAYNQVWLTQFYQLPGTSVPPAVIEAIGRLFGKIG